jgi:RNA polymerase sigma factor (sigma-70 family)
VVRVLSREDEIELSRRIALGDVDARNELAERSLPMIWWACRTLSVAVDDELYSDLQLRLLKTAGMFDANRSTWPKFARRSLLQEIGKHFAKCSRRKAEQLSDDDAECLACTPTCRVELREAAQAMLLSLRSDEQRIVVRHYYGGLSVRDIARREGQSYASTRRTLQRAHEKMREAVAC